MSIFELHEVNAGYRDVPVLRDLGLTVSDGEFVSVIGPNGAGKSTLVKTLSGDVRPSSGTVLFKGRRLRDYRARVLARELSVVHQAAEALAPFTVYEFIRLGRFPHQDSFVLESDRDREMIARAAEATGVAGLLSRRLTELSGGELQLARIAHALAQNSSVILLDEPVSHLDIQHAVMIMDILWKLNREGATVVTVLHDINIASDYSTRIVGLREGGVFFSGAPAEVLRYDLVEALFGTSCIVLKNPTTGRPFVYPVPGYVQKEGGVT
ncbi:MAG TPA: ABC transporter ATP-binding protein [Spirochaetota bacterium]|nr:ABC transporter ATP-binding protein [Spirochaetota bacterium]